MATATLPSACPLDCPDHCSLDVTVEDGRVLGIEGSRERSPITQGFICAKVRHFARHVHGPDRILRPGLRTGAKGTGALTPIGWDRALDLVAERLRRVAAEHGAEAILPFSYGGSNGYLTQDTADARLFRRLGSARLARTVCAAATTAAARALYGGMPGVSYEDYPAARLIVVWGANPSVSGIHLVPYIQAARRAGAALVVVDPRRTPLAKKADLHLAPRPGADLPLALALHRWLFTHDAADRAFLDRWATGADALRARAEPWTPARAGAESGVDEATIEAFARLYAERAPAVIRCGWGAERNRNGGSAIAAILALPAVAGKFGVRGGGYTLSNSGAWRLDAGPLVAAPEPATRVVNMNRLGRELTERPPRTRLLFVYNANPLVTLPEQTAVRAGLAREDLFTVVFDAVLTDTARYADLVLPATTFLEHRDLRAGYGATTLQDAAPAIPPVGESRPNHAVFAALCDRLGLSRPGEAGSVDDFARGLLDQAGNGELTARLADGGAALPAGGARPVMFVDRLPATADGKIHLFPAALDAEAPDGLYRYRADPATAAYPLALVSPATRHTISSTLGQLRTETDPIRLHPADAAARGIGSGDPVRVWNDGGEVRCHAAVDRDLRLGVASMAKGSWLKASDNGVTVNALVPATLTDVAGGACFNDARVEVAKIEG